MLQQVALGDISSDEASVLIAKAQQIKALEGERHSDKVGRADHCRQHVSRCEYVPAAVGTQTAKQSQVSARKTGRGKRLCSLLVISMSRVSFARQKTKRLYVDKITGLELPEAELEATAMHDEVKVWSTGSANHTGSKQRWHSCLDLSSVTRLPHRGLPALHSHPSARPFRQRT